MKKIEVNGKEIDLSSVGLGVYGTLRPGDYNYERFKLNEVCDKIATETLQGYHMRDLGPYPAIVENGESEVVVDYLYPKEEVAKDVVEYIMSTIYLMEKGALYETTVVEREGKQYLVFYYPEDTEGNLVENGDWIEHKRRRTEKALSH